MDFRACDVKIKFRKKTMNYKSAISVSITTAGLGMIFSWTSPALPHLTSTSSTFPVSEIQGAWIASIVGAGTISGFLINPILISRLGSKRTLLLWAVPQILSWFIIYLGKNWLLLCAARIIGGIGYGGGMCSTTIYLSEVGDENTRGIFLTLVKMSINIGIFISMFFGAFLSYDAMNLALLCIPVIFVITFFSMPDAKQFMGLENLDEFGDEKLLGKGFDVGKEMRSDCFEKKRLVTDDGGFGKGNHFGDDGSLNKHSDGLNKVGDCLSIETNGLFKETTDLIASISVRKEKTFDVLKEDIVLFPQNKAIFVENEHVVDIVVPKSIGNIGCLLEKNSTSFLKQNSSSTVIENRTNITDALVSTVESKTDNLSNALGSTTIPPVENGLKDSTIRKKTFKEDFLNLLVSAPGRKSPRSVWWKLLCLKNNRMALLIIIVSALTDIFSGHMVIVSYTQQIFEYSGASLKAEYAALILAVLKIAASLVSVLVVEKFGRRNLFLITGILAGLSEGCVGLFYFLKLYLKVDVSAVTWLPLFGVSMYEVVGSVGLSSLYYVYQGELFSDDVRGLGVTCTNVSYEVITFFLKFFFQIVIDAIGIYSVFWGFAISCVILSCITYWISPETKGKSRVEIQRLLGG